MCHLFIDSFSITIIPFESANLPFFMNTTTVFFSLHDEHFFAGFH